MFLKALQKDRNDREPFVVVQSLIDQLGPRYWVLRSEHNTSKTFEKSGVIISSYVLKTLVLFEWQDYPDEN